MAHRGCVHGLTWDYRVYSGCVQGMTEKTQGVTGKDMEFSYGLRFLKPVV